MSLREPFRFLRYPALACLLLLSALIPGSDLSSQASLDIGNYQLVSEQPQKGATVLFTYRATLTNGGGALASAIATATSLSSKTKIVDGTLTFGPVAAGGTLVSSDTFSLSRSPKQRFDWADIVWTVVAVPNHPPVANAGPDLTRSVGQSAQLDGSASSDQDGNSLTYHWTLTSIPPGSQATLSDAAAVKPTLLIDAPGTYVATLIVNDGFADSVPDSVSISTVNSAPVAHAGPDQTHVIHTTVTLNGSGSSDINGDPLTYSWAFVSRPPDSTAALANPTSVTPSFEMDRAGTYVVRLVVHDGFLFSAADTVSITTLNSPPVANAGPDQTLFVTNSVTLDGTGSTDVDGSAITYSWALISVPTGSGAALDGATVPRPTFVIDRPGMYVAQLVVHDGTVASTPDTVTITTENSPPVANPGAAQTVVAGRFAVLDGNASSDVDGDPLTFRWSFASVPLGSTAVLAGATGATPSFVLDKEGMFVVQLIVSDGVADSAPATVTITTTNSVPAANAGADHMNVLVGTVVTLDGTQSADADEQPVSHRWSLLSKPGTSNAGLSNDTSATPTIVPDVPGDYVAQLIVNDGFADSAPDTVVVHAVPVPVVTVAAVDPDAAEAYFEPGLIRLTRSDGSRAVTVSFAIGGTATNGGDFQQFGTTAFLDAGQTTVDLPIAPTDDMLVEGPESVSVTLVPGAEYTVGDPATAEVTIADKPSIALALVDTPVVGVGIPATLRVTLGAPASHGGVTVTVTSDDPARLEVAAPGSVSIADGETFGDIVLRGLAPSTVAIHAGAAHYQDGTLAVTVVRNIISIPSTFNATLGQPSSLPITIERDASNQGPVSINLVSDDAAIISVSTPTITIPAGEVSGHATIVGESIGSTTVRGTATSFVSDTGVGTVAAALDITATTVTINSATGGSITIELESPPGTPSAAPSGGLLVNLSAANPACVSVPATVTIASGAISAAPPATYGGTATLPCTTTVTATGPAGFASDSISVTVNQAPSITAPMAVGAVGAGLQIGAFSATLSAAQQSVVKVRLTSNDATRVLLSPEATTPGAGVIEIDVPAGQTTLNFHVHGADWMPLSSTAGTVTITFWADGFTGAATSVNYVQPALELSLPTATSSASPNTDFTVRVGLPAADNATLASPQPRRAGASPLTVTVRNSQAAVAEIDANGGGNGAQEQTASIAAGQFSTPANAAGGLEFDPKAGGTTIVTAAIPGFTATTAAAKTVTVAASPLISFLGGLPTIGGGLQNGAYSATIPSQQQTDLVVHLVSDDPSLVLLAPNTIDAGLAAIDVTIPAGQTSLSFHVQGTDWVIGTSVPKSVTITASAEGHTDGSTSITYVQPALDFVSLPASTTSLSASSLFVVRVGVPAPGDTHLATELTRRPATQQERDTGIVPNLTVTVTSGTATVAQIEKIVGFQNGIPVVNPAPSQTAIIAAGASRSPGQVIGGLRLDPVDAGTTVVTAGIPGFITTAAGNQTVTVTATAGINFPSGFGQLAGGLQIGQFTGNLLASQHPGVTVLLTSTDPSRVLLAPTATTPGTETIEFNLATGQTGFTYFLQATDWVIGTSSAASVTIRATATGFNSASGTVNYVQPALELGNLPTTTTDLSVNTDFITRVGVPGTGALAAVQARRAGAAPLTVTVTNSNETVAELDDNGGVNGLQEKTASILAGQQTTPIGVSGGLEFDPLSTGTTVVTATIPGFITTAAGARTVTVVTPGINIPSQLGSVGGGLQLGQLGGSLAATQHGGVTVHLVSRDPSRVLLSPNATTPGLDAIDVDVANGQIGFSFFVQGTDWIPGTSSAAPVGLTITAPGFVSASTSVNYVQPAVDLQSVPATIGATAANVDFTVRVGVPAALNASVTPQPRRAGAAPLIATVGTDDTAVAEIDLNGGVNGAQPQTASIAAGQGATPFNTAGGLEFDPKAQGTTIVTATIPGFITTTAGAKAVTINP
jgi:K319L-like, PKD domain/PKD domain